MISPCFARHLRDMRASCNRQFHDAKLQYPHLDAARFTYFLEQYADGLVITIESKKPQASRHVAATAYLHGLQLTGLNWIAAANDPNGGLACLALAWQRYIPHFVDAYPDHTNSILVMVAHALHQFSLHPLCRPQQWLQRMLEMVPTCPQFSLWKQAGQVLAWQAGLSHFRESALLIADQLPPTLALQIVGATNATSWTELAAQFRQHPWWEPSNTPSTPLQERWRIGGFIEFGGAFTTTPQVTLHDGQWLVKSGDATWLLRADAYGATLHRLTTDEAGSASFKNPSGKTVGISGQHIIYAQTMFSLQDIESISSWAHDDTTLVVCSMDTFAVIVLSLHGGMPAELKSGASQ